MNYLIPLIDDLLIISLFLTIPFYWLNHQKALSLQTGLSTTLAWFLALTIKKIFPTPRPYLLENLDPLVNRPPTDGAFPSAHAAAAFAIAITIFLYNKKWGIITFCVAILVGLMRILGRVHYPIDIIGGAILGITTAYIVHKSQNTQKIKNPNNP